MYEPADPHCAKMTFVGHLRVENNTKVVAEIKQKMLSHHPVMKTWPENQLSVVELETTALRMTSSYGGSSALALDVLRTLPLTESAADQRPQSDASGLSDRLSHPFSHTQTFRSQADGVEADGACQLLDKAEWGALTTVSHEFLGADDLCGGVPYGAPQAFVRVNSTLFFYDTPFSMSMKDTRQNPMVSLTVSHAQVQ
jgi:hypothetical protein